MRISVIIPTYNAEKYLQRLLQSLKQQSISFELLIIDSSSLDDTIQIANEYADKIITIPKAEFDHGATRTKAAKASSGDILIFLTQDAIFSDSRSIEEILKVFQDKEVAAAYGRQLAHEDTNIFGKHLRSFNYPASSYVRTLDDKEKYGIKTSFLSDSFSAYRRTILEEVQWFKSGLIFGEDAHIGAKILKAKYALAYASQAKVYHSHSYTILEEFKRYFDVGVFHKRENWILETFGKAEGEGTRFIKSEFNYLLKHHAYFRILESFFRNAMKYLGYKLGSNYESFPVAIIKKLSLHPQWWDKHS